jgi:hypothetical protein
LIAEEFTNATVTAEVSTVAYNVGPPTQATVTTITDKDLIYASLMRLSDSTTPTPGSGMTLGASHPASGSFGIWGAYGVATPAGSFTAALTPGVPSFASLIVLGIKATLSTSGIGSDGDFYVNISTGTLWFRASGLWSKLNISVNVVNDTKPLSSAFSWDNQGGSVTHDQSDRLVVEVPDSYVSVVSRMLKQAALTAPYTVQVGGHLNGAILGNNGCILYAMLRESGSGKLVGAGACLGNGTFLVRRDFWNSSSSYSAGSMSTNLSPGSGSKLWLRITDDGTNRKFYHSVNGKDFFLFGSEASNTTITPDEVGIGFYYNTGGVSGSGPAIFTISDFKNVGSILPQFAS